MTYIGGVNSIHIYGLGSLVAPYSPVFKFVVIVMCARVSAKLQYPSNFRLTSSTRVLCSLSVGTPFSLASLLLPVPHYALFLYCRFLPSFFFLPLSYCLPFFCSPLLLAREAEEFVSPPSLLLPCNVGKHQPVQASGPSRGRSERPWAH
jgi:hypothetical protein